VNFRAQLSEVKEFSYLWKKTNGMMFIEVNLKMEYFKEKEFTIIIALELYWKDHL
jgi:hypothetical protein